MANIVLGVSGSVAAYRAADLARELMRSGHTVRVCLTDAAQKFVSAALFEALTRQPCLVDTFEEPERGRMAHIDWARQADLIVVAPATANTISRIAHGIGDDMLTTIILATTARLLVAPAMNPQMYANEAFQTSLSVLRRRGVTIVEPSVGDVACGENGQGKLASITTIRDAAVELLARSQLLLGKHVLITSGPTQEPIDDVRFLSNRSSGKMGSALAWGALQLGAQVTVIAGPQREALPEAANVVSVKTAIEMLDAALAVAPNADLIIGAAAVADYRPEYRAEGKLRRTDEKLSLDLVPNPDIIASLARVALSAKVVAFAAEPSLDLEIARAKLVKKGVYAIAVNDISNPEIGFESEENALQLLFADGRIAMSGRKSKRECALWLLETL